MCLLLPCFVIAFLLGLEHLAAVFGVDTRLVSITFRMHFNRSL